MELAQIIITVVLMDLLLEVEEALKALVVQEVLLIMRVPLQGLVN